MKQVIDEKDFDIRYSTEDDCVYLKKWFLSDGMLRYFSMEDEKEIDDMVFVWRSYCKYRCCLTAEYQKTPCGMAALFLLPYIKVAHQSMAYILVDPKIQRRGVGTALVKNLDHLANKYFKLEKVGYEIFENKALSHLLEKQGYKHLFSQEKYVKEKDGTYTSRSMYQKEFAHG